MSSQPKRLSADELVCANCAHSIWAVALGLGVRCSHEANQQPDGKHFQIPRRRYTCDHFEFRDRL